MTERPALEGQAWGDSPGRD